MNNILGDMRYLVTAEIDGGDDVFLENKMHGDLGNLVEPKADIAVHIPEQICTL